MGNGKSNERKGTAMEFDKCPESFPVKKEFVFLAHCAVSPLLASAFRAERDVAEDHMRGGALMFVRYREILDELRSAAAELLAVDADDLAFVKNTSEALSMIGGGYPFREGDRIVSYVHEYPANHYPWRLQERRGAELVLLPDRDLSGGVSRGRPCGFAMEDLEAALDERVKIVALSHVQFTSGFAADLEAIGALCRERGADLVVDAAQSLGALPLKPEKWGISALAASGWKWLCGPVGTGLMYVSPAFREKIDTVMTGADMMKQANAYLDHTWAPLPAAARFEYSTSPVGLAAALHACVRDLPLRYGVDAVRDEILRLQDAALDALDRDRFAPVVFPGKNRSGILALTCDADLAAIVEALGERGVVCTGRGGYLRIAPHVYLEEAEVRRAIGILNGLAG